MVFLSEGRMCSRLSSAAGFPLVPANTRNLKASYLFAGLALDALSLSLSGPGQLAVALTWSSVVSMFCFPLSLISPWFV